MKEFCLVVKHYKNLNKVFTNCLTITWFAMMTTKNTKQTRTRLKILPRFFILLLLILTFLKWTKILFLQNLGLIYNYVKTKYIFKKRINTFYVAKMKTKCWFGMKNSKPYVLSIILKTFSNWMKRLVKELSREFLKQHEMLTRKFLLLRYLTKAKFLKIKTLNFTWYTILIRNL